MFDFNLIGFTLISLIRVESYSSRLGATPAFYSNLSAFFFVLNDELYSLFLKCHL